MRERFADRLLEAPIAPSFSRLGLRVRARMENWRSLGTYDLSGRTVAITGASSGLGWAAAHRLADLGARLIVIGRNDQRTNECASSLANPNGVTHTALTADLSEPADVHRLADTLRTDHSDLDTLIHNAGALLNHRATNSAGIEVTVAAQVLAPFALTGLLLDTLRGNRPARVLTMSSGGMYTAGLTVNRLQMSSENYRGSEQYARAKRAQVTLNEQWAALVPASEVVFHSLHPGWADTPGVQDSLPRFHRYLKPALRSPAEGVDTLVWLVADDHALDDTGVFWHDRHPRPLHRLPRTRRSDTPKRRAELWDWCRDQTGIDPPPSTGS